MTSHYFYIETTGIVVAAAAARDKLADTFARLAAAGKAHGASILPGAARRNEPRGTLRNQPDEVRA
ncbi:hypothetical protein [Paraburkholderia sp.]|uniref:hypothetical protein n=1 Tax=Paraburkholderia sp. TaxID=1926495 RepID=UPI0025DFFAF0|nr:hypothetical protein [Paraburkholderia sp.]